MRLVVPRISGGDRQEASEKKSLAKPGQACTLLILLREVLAENSRVGEGLLFLTLSWKSSEVGHS